MAPVLYVDVETFGGNWRQDVKNDVSTSKSSYWRELSYTPNVRRHFLASVGFMEIPVRYARKELPQGRGISLRELSTATIALYFYRFY